MGQKIVTYYLDDIDGTDAAVTRTITIDGNTFEVDLNEEHSAELDTALAKFKEAGRPAVRTMMRRRGPGAVTPKAARDYDPAEVRAWAQTNDLPAPARGRIPGATLDAWRDRNKVAIPDPFVPPTEEPAAVKAPRRSRAKAAAATEG